MPKISNEYMQESFFKKINQLNDKKYLLDIGGKRRIKNLSNTIKSFEQQMNKDNCNKNHVFYGVINLLHSLESNKFNYEKTSLHQYIDFNENYLAYCNAFSHIANIYNHGSKSQENRDKINNIMRIKSDNFNEYLPINSIFTSNSNELNILNNYIIYSLKDNVIFRSNNIKLGIESINKKIDKLECFFNHSCEKYYLLSSKDETKTMAEYKLEKLKNEFIKFKNDLNFVLENIKNNYSDKVDNNDDLKLQINKENTKYSECMKCINEIKKKLNVVLVELAPTDFEVELLNDALVHSKNNKLSDSMIFNTLLGMTKENELEYHLNLMKSLIKSLEFNKNLNK